MRLELLALSLATVPLGFGLGWMSIQGGGDPNNAPPTAAHEPTGRRLSALPDKGSGAAEKPSLPTVAPGTGEFTKFTTYLKLVKTAKTNQLGELLTQLHSDRYADEFALTSSLIDLVIKRWAEEDPVTFLREVLKQPSWAKHEGREMMEVLAEANYCEAWPVIRSLEHRGRRDELSHAFLDSLVEHDPDAALRLAEDLNPVTEKSKISEIITNVAWERPLKALAFAESQPMDRTAFRIGMMAKDGKVALRPNFRSRHVHGAVKAIAKPWAMADHTAAVAWAESQSGARREAALEAAVTGWGNVAPFDAIDYAFENMDSARRPNVFEDLLREGSMPIELNRRMAEDGELRMSAGRSRFLGSWLQQDPSAAAEWLDDRPGDAADELMQAGARTWANMDRRAAAVEVVKIDAPGLRAIAVEQIAESLRWNDQEIEMADEVREALKRLRQ